MCKAMRQRGGESLNFTRLRQHVWVGVKDEEERLRKRKRRRERRDWRNKEWKTEQLGKRKKDSNIRRNKCSSMIRGKVLPPSSVFKSSKLLRAHFANCSLLLSRLIFRPEFGDDALLCNVDELPVHKVSQKTVSIVTVVRTSVPHSMFWSFHRGDGIVTCFDVLE
jgi:hypothetical protein